ncbi:carotenoid biosynthesis protein [Algivirga pacifica]|uniref:Carotenoid biosynthesis protein n=1 Tax=Algivirga pacifica TaxID=1162670 RepID=A0ABP9D411_9BACT
MTLQLKHSVWLVYFFLTVGVIGMATPWSAIFVNLTPMMLLMILVVLLYLQQVREAKRIALIGLIFTIGYAAEILGVNTGVPFGNYTYGSTLGPKWLETPPMIGVNWVIVSLISVSLVPFKNEWLKLFLSAGILVLLDILIEPVAIHFEWWTWEEGIVPLQNYVGWYVVGLVANFIGMEVVKERQYTAMLGAGMFVFFVALNILVN